MRYKETKELVQGDKLAEDVYRNSVLILRAGTELDIHMKEKLIRLGVLEVAVETENPEAEDTQTASQPILNSDKESLVQLFRSLLKQIATDERYGLSLQENDRAKGFENLFVSSLSIQAIFEKLMELRKWDRYSFEHSFDVFLLGMILAEASGLDDLGSFAVGCLLHDIGKMEIPQDILLKKGKLTTSEFEFIQTHTLRGRDMILRTGLPNPFASLALSHHERLDGSGYPEGLNKKQLDQATRILMIVDVYSAITMDRVYREPLPAAKAMEMLFRENRKFDLGLLKVFANQLHIFPVGSEVLLSNGKRATVTYVNPHFPSLPRLRLFDHPKAIQIPFNLRVRIDLFVGWNEKNGTMTQREVEWNRYLYALTTGDHEDALEAFEYLEDGKRVEEIFSDIFAKSINEIESLFDNGIISAVELSLASSTTREILYSMLKGYERNQKRAGQTVLVTVGEEISFLRMQIAAAALKVNSWKVFNLEFPLAVEDLSQFLMRRSLRMVCLIQSGKTNPDLMEMVQALKEKLPSLIIAVGGNQITTEVRKKVDVVFSDIKEMVSKLENFRDLSN